MEQADMQKVASAIVQAFEQLRQKGRKILLAAAASPEFQAMLARHGRQQRRRRRRFALKRQ